MTALEPLLLVHDDAADVLPLVQVLVSLVDLVETVPPGDELIELELARPVQPQQPGDVVQRVAHPEDMALDPALPPDHGAVGGKLYLPLRAAPHRGHRHLAALADDRRRLLD